MPDIDLLRPAGGSLADYDRVKSLRKLEALSVMAPHSLEAHTRLLMRTDAGDPIIAAAHHSEWASILENRRDYPYVCIIAPPGSAKTTWVSLAYPSWRLGAMRGKVRIGLVCNTASQAFALSRSIQAVIENPRYQRTYGIGPDYDRGWAQHAFFVTGAPEGPNPSLLAAGIGGPIIGKRFDEIILDDPTTWDEARSEIVMEGIRHWMKTTLITRFPVGRRPPYGEGSRMTVVLTRWGMRDIVPTLEEIGFKVVHMPALGYWDRHVVCPACGAERERDWAKLLQRCEHCDSDVIPAVEFGETALWPEAESKEQLLQEQEDDPIIFSLVKQGDPTALTGEMFDPANFQRGVRPDPNQFDTIVQFADTAGGKDAKKGDYFALCTIGVTREKTVWVLDMDRNRYTAPEQEIALNRNFELWSEWWGKPVNLICVEDVNEGTALFQRMVRETRLPLKAVKPQRDKTFRAIPLANAYKQRIVWHPEGERWVRAFEIELTAFGPAGGGHDDQVDAAAGAFTQTSDGPKIRVI